MAKTSAMVSIKLTDKEKTILDRIPVAPKKISSKDLMREYYNGNEPLNAQTIINSRLRQLIRKLEMSTEKIRIMKSEQTGPNPIFFWIVKV